MGWGVVMITVVIIVINDPVLVIDHKGCDHVLQGWRVGSPPMRSRWPPGSTDQLATDDGSKAAVPSNCSGNLPDQRFEIFRYGHGQSPWRVAAEGQATTSDPPQGVGVPTPITNLPAAARNTSRLLMSER